jgi:type III secretion system FlhB-like substrate exporter
MKNKYNDEIINNGNVLEEISKEYIETAVEYDLNIEKDPKVLKNTLDMDIRDNIPPQLLLIVSGIVNIIETLEKGEK